jgi:hypothetical protein
MTIFRTLGVTALALAASVGVAAAATINFSSGKDVGDTYVEKNFTFAYVGSGSVSLSSDCGSKCLKLPNASGAEAGKVVRMTFSGGQKFSLLSFAFNGKDGQGPALYVSTTLEGSDQLFSEDLTGIEMSLTGPLSLFSDVTELYFRTASEGSARVDDLMVETAAVPLPAAGWLMLLGLGGLAAARRRKA